MSKLAHRVALFALIAFAAPPLASHAQNALPEKIVCELEESPANHLEFDRASSSITVIWHMVSHDGSSKDWREPWVDATHASGYNHDFRSCQSSFAQTSPQPETYRFSYSCPGFTTGELVVQRAGSSYFHSDTKFSDGDSKRDQKLENCQLIP